MQKIEPENLLESLTVNVFNLKKKKGGCRVKLNVFNMKKKRRGCRAKLNVFNLKKNEREKVR